MPGVDVTITTTTCVTATPWADSKNVRLSEILTMLRQERGLSRDRLSDAAGLTSGTIYRIEKELTRPQAMSVQSIMITLDRIAPIEDEIIQEVSEATDIKPSLLRHGSSQPPSPAEKPADRVRRELREMPLSEDARRIAAWIDRLLARSTVEEVEDKLRFLVAMADHDRGEPLLTSAPARMTGPEIVGQGIAQQTVTYYGPAEHTSRPEGRDSTSLDRPGEPSISQPVPADKLKATNIRAASE